MSPVSFDSAVFPLDNALLENLLQNSPDCVKILDVNGILLWMNRGGLIVNEIDDFEPFRNACWPRLWPDNTAPLAEAAVEQARQGHIGHFVGFCPTAKGTPRWWDVTVLPLQQDARPLQYLHAVCRDITVQHEREIANARLEAVVNSSADAIIGFDIEGRITTWNGGAERIFGWTEAEALGQTYALIGTEEVRQFQSDIFHNLTRDKIAARYVTKRRRKDGSLADVSVTTSPLMFNGAVQGASAIVCDITEQVKTAEELRQRNAMLDALLQKTDSAIYMKDLKGRFLLANPTCLRVLNRAAEEVTGLDETAFFAPEVALPIMRDDAEIMQSGKGRVFEELAPVDGVMHTFLSVKNPMYDARENVIGIIGISTDITDRKRDEAEIQDLNVRLHRAMQETHHRVKNNLQVISALTEIQTLEAGDPIPASTLQRIGQQVRTLASIHDLLTQQIKTNAHSTTISIRDILEKLTLLLQSTLKNRAILYQAVEARLTMEQSSSFAMLVSELVSNAVKHGKGAIEINLTHASPSSENAKELSDRMLRLEVRDDGPGFPPDFDPQTSANTGIELIDSLTRWDLRGSVAYSNRPEGGACVAITFPGVE